MYGFVPRDLLRVNEKDNFKTFLSIYSYIHVVKHNNRFSPLITCNRNSSKLPLIAVSFSHIVTRMKRMQLVGVPIENVQNESYRLKTKHGTGAS